MSKAQKILAATQRLLAEKGLSNTSMAMIAAEAQMATGTIYHYFQDQHDLFKQLSLQLTNEIAEHVLIGFDPYGEPYAQYHRVWNNLYDYLSKDMTALKCKRQFETCPTYYHQPSTAWKPIWAFFEQLQAKKAIIDLPVPLLTALSFDTIPAVIERSRRFELILTTEQKEQLILASWQAIRHPDSYKDLSL